MNQVQDMKPTKTDIERYIAQRFCKHLGDGCTLLKRESPDFLLCWDDREIGLELARVRDPDAQDIGLIHHNEFAGRIGPRWVKDKDVRHWLVSFEYRLEPSFKPGNAGQYLVPRKGQTEEVFVELKNAIAIFDRGDIDTRAVMRFSEDYPRGYRRPRREEGLYLTDRTKYPVLSCHFKTIRFYGGGQGVFGRPETSFNFGAVGIDARVVRRLIRKKLAAKLPDYRKSLPGFPIWLLLYNEGDAGTRLIWEDRDIPRFQDIVIEACNVATDRFEQVWWGTDMMVDDSSPPSFLRLA